MPARMMKTMKNRLKKCCKSHPDGQARARDATTNRAGVAADECSTEALSRRPLAIATATIRRHEADREQPEQVEPSAAPDTHARSDAVHVRNRAGPCGRVDDVLAWSQLPAIAADDVRRDTRWPRVVRILRGGILVAAHRVKLTPTHTYGIRGVLAGARARPAVVGVPVQGYRLSIRYRTSPAGNTLAIVVAAPASARPRVGRLIVR